VIDLNTIKIVAGLLGSAVAVGYGGHVILEEKADRQDVVVAGAKVDFIYDKMIESKYEKIITLDKKVNKSPDELEQLRYLRKEVDRLREVKEKK